MARNFMVIFIPWEMRIKKIESECGRAGEGAGGRCCRGQAAVWSETGLRVLVLTLRVVRGRAGRDTGRWRLQTSVHCPPDDS